MLPFLLAPLAERVWRRPPPALPPCLRPRALHDRPWSNAFYLVEFLNCSWGRQNLRFPQRCICFVSVTNVRLELGFQTLGLSLSALHIGCCRPRKDNNPIVFQRFRASPIGVKFRVKFDNGLQCFLLCCTCCWPFGGASAAANADVASGRVRFIAVIGRN